MFVFIQQMCGILIFFTVKYFHSQKLFFINSSVATIMTTSRLEREIKLEFNSYATLLTVNDGYSSYE